MQRSLQGSVTDVLRQLHWLPITQRMTTPQLEPCVQPTQTASPDVKSATASRALRQRCPETLEQFTVICKI